MPKRSHDRLVATAHEAVSPALAACKEDVRIASPYLGSGPMRDLRLAGQKAGVRARLLTCLDPAAAAVGVLDLAGLKAALAAGVEIRTLEKLHAKVYLVDRTFGLVGSGNFTAAGLGFTPRAANVELGVRLGRAEIRDATILFDQWWRSARRVTPALLDKVARAAASLPPRPPRPVPDSGDPVDAQRTEELEQLLEEARTVTTWMKAVYGDFDPNDPWLANGWFSSSKRGRPSFEVGDLIVVYFPRHRTCNAIVQINETAHQDPKFLRQQGAPRAEIERWPWINGVEGRITVPAAEGVTPAQLGVDPRALQSGHVRMTYEGFASAARHFFAVR